VSAGLLANTPLPIAYFRILFYSQRSFLLEELEKYYEGKEIQFGEEELSGGKWALTDRWTLGTGQAETKRGSVRI